MRNPRMKRWDPRRTRSKKPGSDVENCRGLPRSVRKSATRILHHVARHPVRARTGAELNQETETEAHLGAWIVHEDHVAGPAIEVHLRRESSGALERLDGHEARLVVADLAGVAGVTNALVGRIAHENARARAQRVGCDEDGCDGSLHGLLPFIGPDGVRGAQAPRAVIRSVIGPGASAGRARRSQYLPG